MKTILSMVCALFLLASCAVFKPVVKQTKEDVNVLRGNWRPLGTGFRWSVSASALATLTSPLISGNSVFLNGDLYIKTLDGGKPLGGVPITIALPDWRGTLQSNEKGKLKLTLYPPYPYHVVLVIDADTNIINVRGPGEYYAKYDRAGGGAR